MYKRISIILIGFTAMASQIVFLREFLVAFYGNELSIGFVIANWLIAGAIGSLVLGRFADRIKSKITVFIVCQLAVSILLALDILLIRSVKIFLHAQIGEAISVLGMTLSSFIIIAPICAMFSFMFVLACRIYEQKSMSSAGNIGMVYSLEAVGSMLGGLLAGFVLIKLLDSVEIIAILSFFNVAMGFLLTLFFKKTPFRRFFITVTLAMLLIVALMWLLGGFKRLNEYSLRNQWQGHTVVGSENSVYGNVTVTKESVQISFFYNGQHLYAIPDTQHQEEAVHFALLEHPDPQNVLLVGGGGGLIEEILKHPVKKIDYVELDPLIIKMAKLYLPVESQDSLKDPRVSIKNIDARLFIRETQQSYDCIIINLGDPSTAQVNRYYTVEFFKALKKILNKGGVVSFGLSCSESYINRPLKDFLASIYVTLKNVFRDVKIIPGDTAYFLGCDTMGVLTYDYNLLVERLKKRNINAKYVREYYLFSMLAKEKIEYIEDSVAFDETAKINQDFRPIAYYYDIIFKMSRFGDSLFGNALKLATARLLWLIIFVACAAIFLFAKIVHRNIFMAAIFLTGFSQMVFQVIILLSFQIIHGWVFYKLGIIFTSFMAGLSLGSWFVTRAMADIKKDLAVFIWFEAAICVYSLALPLFFKQGAYQGLFMALPVIAGFIAGGQFPLANKILLQDKKTSASVAGVSYGIDLLGACLGAFLTEMFLIPALGIVNTCVATAALNFVVLVLLLVI